MTRSLRQLAAACTLSILVACQFWYQPHLLNQRNLQPMRVAKEQSKVQMFECGGETITPKHPRLELIHVPKTGGTSLETLAANHNVTWGKCHYKNDRECRPVWPQGRRSNRVHRWTRASNWHTPLNVPHGWPQWAQNASLFMVVRNPYERALSEWKYTNQYPGLRRKNRIPKNSVTNLTMMNEWLQRKLQTVWENPPLQEGENSTSQISPVADKYYQNDAHFIPQMDYWIPDMYVLRMENFQETLPCLLRHFGWQLQWNLSSARINAAPPSVTVSDLSIETRRMIEQLYSQDFAEFGYEKVQRTSTTLSKLPYW